MQSLSALPYIAEKIKEGKYDEGLGIMNRSLEVLVPHLRDTLSLDIDTDERNSLILAKAYLLLGDSNKCVKFALKARNLLHELDKFYHESILGEMMQFLISNCKVRDDFTKELKSYVLSVIKDDVFDDSLLGFLAEIGEFDLLKQKLKELSKTNISCKELMDHLLDFYYENVNQIFPECSIENPSFLEYIIDSYITLNRDDDLMKFIFSLPWQYLYRACFYIEDSYPDIARMKIESTQSKNSSISYQNACFILTGEWKKEIMSTFVMKNTKTSFKFLENMAKARAPYISLCNCIMNAATTNDTLYRNNKGMLTGREWTRFIEYSCIGMVHQGNDDGFEILKEMLPSLDSSVGEPGALMALGAMSVGSGDRDVTDFLLNWLDSSNDEIVFGACMGLGLNLIERQDDSIADRLKQLLTIDSTIAQESALYAIGLIYSGSGNEDILEFLITISKKSDFPRVKRVAGIAIALVSILGNPYEKTISLLTSSDSTERAASLLALGCAYTASADLNVIKSLLVYVNDGDDDTKRAAVIAIGLVGYLDPLIKSSVLVPLAQNHNAHVRGAVALTLGMLNCGMGDIEVCAMLEAMTYDSDDIVRQSACIGAGFALVQMNPDLVPNYKRTLDRINLILASKDETQCAKIGASIGRAIAEAGGRSIVFSLKNQTGQLDCKRVAGALLFLNSFYWYPLFSCISLMALPTPLFFFDENLEQTDEVLENDPKFYDFLVKMPEMRKSRRFKSTPKIQSDTTDSRTNAPEGLRSGVRITLKEMIEKSIDCGVFFRENNK